MTPQGPASVAECYHAHAHSEVVRGVLWDADAGTLVTTLASHAGRGARGAA
jgi:hypothetical protein